MTKVRYVVIEYRHAKYCDKAGELANREENCCRKEKVETEKDRWDE